MQLLIKGGRVVDPGHPDKVADIYIQDGKIARINEADSVKEDLPAGTTIVDAGGKLVFPGLIDMHVHFREPGFEYKETIETGCLAAAHGGFTAVCTMPNTHPVNDSAQITQFILEKAHAANGVKVYPAGAISVGLEGKRLCEYGELSAAGVVALTDDGNPVADAQFMRRAMEYARSFNLLIISHCEIPELMANGVMNEGTVATRLGLAGIPNAAESIAVMRDIELCELTGARLHIAHISTRESVDAVRQAKKRGIAVTAETAPHYFTLTDEAVEDYNTHAKMNPPLRSRQDQEAVLQGLADGTIDAIATDHAPHCRLDKDVEFDNAANGIIGLETSLPLSLALVEKGVLTLTGLVAKMAVNPAQILGIPCGIKIGNAADITIVDPDILHRLDARQFYSLGRNTPFDNWQVKGKAIMTIIDGNIVYQAET